MNWKIWFQKEHPLVNQHGHGKWTFRRWLFSNAMLVYRSVTSLNPKPNYVDCLKISTSKRVMKRTMTSWWFQPFQPIWKILVKLDHFSRLGCTVNIGKYSKPPRGNETRNRSKSWLVSYQTIVTPIFFGCQLLRP